MLEDMVSKHLREREDGDDVLALWEEIWARASSGGATAVRDFLERLLEHAVGEEGAGRVTESPEDEGLEGEGAE